MMTLHLVIKGKVQGVFYRASAKEEADKRGIAGWIKNTPEGNVEALINGTKDQVHQFIDWCKKGPSGARVTEVVVQEQSGTESLQGFRIVR